MSREVIVAAGVRTAVGTFGGSLKDIPTVDLGAAVVKEVIARAGIEGKDVGHVVFGHVVNTEPRDIIAPTPIRTVPVQHPRQHEHQVR